MRTLARKKPTSGFALGSCDRTDGTRGFGGHGTGTVGGGRRGRRLVRAALPWAIAAVMAACGSGEGAPAGTHVRDAAAAQLARDSATAYGLLAKGDSLAGADLFMFEGLAHRLVPVPEHDAVHDRYVRVLFDSAATLLERDQDRGPAPGLARDLLRQEVLGYDLTEEQLARQDRLLNRIEAQEERIRKEAERAAIASTVDARREFARKLEDTYLDGGMDVTVSTKGPHATTLRIKWIRKRSVGG